MKAQIIVHCNENPIYVFPEKELCGLCPDFHIHVSVSDLYIPRIGLLIFLQQNRETDPWNIKIVHRNINVEIGTAAAHFFSGNICLKFRCCVFAVYPRYEDLS